MITPAKKKKVATPQPTLSFKEPKYAIAEMLRKKYGELNYKQGIEDLKNYCFIKRKQTIAEWLSIEAGEDTEISHFVINRVLSFFNLQSECQLYTDAHNNLLKD